MINGKGGKKWYFDLYRKRNRKIRRGIEKLGLSTYPAKGSESPTVSCINAPGKMGGPDVYKAMRGKGYELAQGYGSLKDSTFRVGNMGWIPSKSIDDMLAALAQVVS
jgi:aspartate aminotransferase-like enzyme